MAVKNLFDEEQLDAVVLAAAFVGGIMANSLYRADFIMMNMKIQCNVISEAYAHDVKRLLFLGSTCIYPKSAPQPMKEDCFLTSALEYTNEEYAIAKIAGLKMCESYNLQYGTNYIAVMPTNLYGPNDNFHLENSHVMPAMMRKIYLAKLINDSNWEAIRKDLTIRPVGANIKENGEAVRYVIDGNSSETEILKVLAFYGIENNKVSLWGTGKPLASSFGARIWLTHPFTFSSTSISLTSSALRSIHPYITVTRLMELLIAIIPQIEEVLFQTLVRFATATSMSVQVRNLLSVNFQNW